MSRKSELIENLILLRDLLRKYANVKVKCDKTECSLMTSMQRLLCHNFNNANAVDLTGLSSGDQEIYRKSINYLIKNNYEDKFLEMVVNHVGDSNLESASERTNDDELGL